MALEVLHHDGSGGGVDWVTVAIAIAVLLALAGIGFGIARLVKRRRGD